MKKTTNDIAAVVTEPISYTSGMTDDRSET